MWWRLVALCAVGAVIAQGIAEVRTARRPTVEPYYVYVNQEGRVLGTERISSRAYDMQGALLERLAGEWIKQVRSVPLDVQVMHANWQEALRLSTAQTAQRLMAYAKLAGLTEIAKKAQERELAVTVSLRNVRTMADRVVRVEWQETVYAGAGSEKDTTAWTGEIEFIVRKPETQKEFEQNALGIWIGRFTWAKDQT